MDDLISRAYLLDLAEKQNNLLDGGDVRSAPSVEAVEVVRCKDCIFFHTFKTPDGIVEWCSCDPRAYKDHFCGLGERKDNANHRMQLK